MIDRAALTEQLITLTKGDLPDWEFPWKQQSKHERLARIFGRRFRPDPLAEQVLTASGSNIRYSDAQIAYDRSRDIIFMAARERLRDAPAFYSVIFHELAHWTGHPDRLNRDTMTKSSYEPRNDEFRREELVAELTSAFLCNELGIPHDPVQTASYLKKWSLWSRSMPNREEEILYAAKYANAACDYLLQLRVEKPRQGFVEGLVRNRNERTR